MRQYFSRQRPSQSARGHAGFISFNNSVPRQGTRLALNQRGHIIFGCRFTKSQSTIEVEQTIIEAFDGKIPLAVHMMNL